MVDNGEGDGLVLMERRGRVLVRCSACGALLVATETHNDDAIRSMVRSSLARQPCCDRWRHDG